MEWTPGTPLPFETAENFRELGGWPAADGRRVKRGLFWRSGALRHIVTPEDRERLRSWAFEWCATCAPVWSEHGSRTRNFPGCAAMISVPSGMLGAGNCPSTPTIHCIWMQTDCRLCGGRWKPSIPRFPLPIRPTGKYWPVSCHCSAGKDRTGVAAALILLALDASRETVMADFLATNDCRPGAVRECLEVYQAKLEREPELRPILETVSGVRPESLQAVFDAIDRRDACMEDFFEAEYGMGPEQLRLLRDQCLE